MSLRRNVLVGLIASGCLLTSSAGNLKAYEPMKVPEAAATPQGAGTVQKAAVSAARETGALSAASKDALKTYTEYVMAKMTEPSIDNTPDKWRTNLTTQFVVAIKSEEGRATVAKAIVAKAVEVINGQYMPQAKINAMVLLAEPRIAGEALSPLFKYATNTVGPANPDVPAHLRSLALFGLDQYVRNAGKNMSAEQRKSVAQAMAEIVKSEPTSIAEEKAHWWMVRRAFDVLSDLHTAGTASSDGAMTAMALFMEPTTVPSVRISAGQYLTRYDLSGADEATRNKILVSVAQILDQEVVGWYEQEQDKTQSGSGMGMMAGMMGGMGGYGAMGMAGGGAEGGADMSAYGSAMAYGGAMGGSSGTGSGPKPIDTQKWDMRLARRKLNTYCQLAHVLLKGTGASEQKDYSATGKGIMETDLPEPLKRPGRLLLEALEQVQTDINERSLTDINTLMTRSVKALDDLRTAAEEIPGMTGADGSVIVPSFNELSPRKKSVKKADAKKPLEAPKTPEQMAADQAAAAGATPPAGEQPAGEQPAGAAQPGAAGAGQPAPGNGANQPAGNQPAGNPPAGTQPPGNQAQPGNQPAGNNPPVNPAAGQ